MPKEFLVFDTLGGCTFAPEPKTGWLERFSHVSDHLALGKAGDFINFLKSDPVGPSCPDDPIGIIDIWLRIFDPGHWNVAFFFHFPQIFKKIDNAIYIGFAKMV